MVVLGPAPPSWRHRAPTGLFRAGGSRPVTREVRRLVEPRTLVIGPGEAIELPAGLRQVAAGARSRRCLGSGERRARAPGPRGTPRATPLPVRQRSAVVGMILDAPEPDASIARSRSLVGERTTPPLYPVTTPGSTGLAGGWRAVWAGCCAIRGGGRPDYIPRVIPDAAVHDRHCPLGGCAARASPHHEHAGRSRAHPAWWGKAGTMRESALGWSCVALEGRAGGACWRGWRTAAGRAIPRGMVGVGRRSGAVGGVPSTASEPSTAPLPPPRWSGFPACRGTGGSRRLAYDGRVAMTCRAVGPRGVAADRWGVRCGI